MSNKKNSIMKIDCADPDFGAVLICAIRYSLGRATYMSHLVMDYIKPLLPMLAVGTLQVIKRDIEDAERYGVGYGQECDKAAWMNFLADVRNELDRRAVKSIE